MKPVPRSVNLALAGLFKHPLRKSQSRRSRKHSIASSSVLDGLVVPAIHILRVALKTPTLRPIHTSGGRNPRDKPSQGGNILTNENRFFVRLP